MQKKLLLFISIFAIMLLTACGNKATTDVGDKTLGNAGDKLSIYATVYPLQYFTERIGGSHVTVKSIYPAGSDEHTFDPTQKDMMALADADLFFYIGLGLEGFVENAEKTLKNEHVQLIATAESIPESKLSEGHSHDEDGHDEQDDEAHNDHEHSAFDPHVWISPTLSIELATSIKDELIKQAPQFESEFEANFTKLQDDLTELDNKFKTMATNAPSKTFFVSHAAFSYLANSYGLEQVAIAGLNSQSEPSQKQLAKIVEEAKDKKVKYVLFEQNVSSKLSDVVRKEIGAESLQLHNLGVLTTDDVKNNETYFSLMEKNIKTLEKALQ